MASYASFKLEFSPDPLSDTTPTWTDVSRFVRGAPAWSSGKAKDLDDPQAGGCSFTLRNDQRQFEPEYVAGRWYPNIVPLRRFRLSIVTSAGTTLQGVYYTTSWTPTYPASTTYSEVDVVCVDGFGLLALDRLPLLDPPNAATIEDVLMFDMPLAIYSLGDPNGAKLAAVTGPEGTYVGGRLMGQAPIVAGSDQTSVTFTSVSARAGAVIDDPGWFSDQNAFTIEAVIETLIDGPILFGPANTGAYTFQITTQRVFLQATTGAPTTAPAASLADGNPHHVAGTWDGNTTIFYVDGVEAARDAFGSTQLISGDTGEKMYIHATPVVAGAAGMTIQYAAFYEQALTAKRIKAHADAALNCGYFAETVGDRINAIATNPLWSVAGITATAHQAAPVMQTGQARLDEIINALNGEKPWGLFYFDDSGNPQYSGWDDTGGTPLAVFGDTAGEVPYTSLVLAYDDELYNDVTANRINGDAQTVDDTGSQSDYKTRSFSPLTDLLLEDDSDALEVAQAVLDRFSRPAYRVTSISLNGANAAARAHILARDIGDVIEIRRRGAGGTPIDVITTILGKQKSIDTNGNLTCTWNLARGFNAADGFWHLGVSGFSELGNTTVLA
jgi:hypothetical protein